MLEALQPALNVKEMKYLLLSVSKEDKLCGLILGVFAHLCGNIFLRLRSLRVCYFFWRMCSFMFVFLADKPSRPRKGSGNGLGSKFVYSTLLENKKYKKNQCVLAHRSCQHLQKVTGHSQSSL